MMYGYQFVHAFRGRGRGPIAKDRRAPVHHSTNLTRIISVTNLKACFDYLSEEGGQAPGIDGICYDDLGRVEVYDALRPLRKLLENGSYRPLPARDVRIPKTSDRGYRKLLLRTILDRTVAKALLCAVGPIFERRFFDGCYGNRAGRSTTDMLMAIAIAAERTRNFIFVKDDVRAAFDELGIADTVTDFQRTLGQDLVDLISVVLRGGEMDRDIGIDQGSPLSPLALNVRLHQAHDTPLEGEAPGRWFRYVDNVAYLSNGYLAAARLRGSAAARLADAKLVLKGGSESLPMDLRGAGVALLGFQFRLKKAGPELGLVQTVWDTLATKLEEAHDAVDPPSLASQIIVGFVNSVGVACRKGTHAAARVANMAYRFGFGGVVCRNRLQTQIDRKRAAWKAAWGARNG